MWNTKIEHALYECSFKYYLENFCQTKKIMKYKKEAEQEGSIGKYFSHKSFPQ